MGVDGGRGGGQEIFDEGGGGAAEGDAVFGQWGGPGIAEGVLRFLRDEGLDDEDVVEEVVGADPACG